MKSSLSKKRSALVIICTCLLILAAKSNAATVTGISSVFKYGQNFLTWTNPVPNGDNNYYLVFRKKKTLGKFTSGDFTNVTTFNDYSNPSNSADAQNSPFFIGYVKGNSSLNKRVTEIYHENNFYNSNNFYFFIPTALYNKNDIPSLNLQQLDSTKGLFVSTTDRNGDYYYLVLIWNANSSNLDKSNFVIGTTQLLVSNEKVDVPWSYFQNQQSPVFKNIDNHGLDKSVWVYTQFVSNMKTGNYMPGFVEMVNKRTGYLAFNYALLTKGNSDNASHFMMMNLHGGGGSFLENGFGVSVNGIVLCVDDWLPNSDMSSSNSGFFGYNEDFDVYNPPTFVPPLIPSSPSKDKIYTAQRILTTINFLESKGVYKNPVNSNSKWTVDASRVYGIGTSMGAGGMMILSQISPATFAAVQLTVPKVNAGFIDDNNTGSCNSWNYCGSNRKQRDSIFGCVTFSGDPNYSNDPLYAPALNCNGCSSIPSNVNLTTNWPSNNSGQKIFNLSDAGYMVQYNSGNNTDLPPIFEVNGRHDCTVGWEEKVKGNWNGSQYTDGVYQKFNNSRQDGFFFWDDRDHNGNPNKAKWGDSSWQPILTKYKSNQSYPAFSNSTGNLGNPGTGNWNGVAYDGDTIGFINGNLDWDVNSIVDNSTNYQIQVYTKDLVYVSYHGQNPNHGHNVSVPAVTCTADVTIRRTQNFHPQDGDQICWASNTQLGSFIYQANTVNGSNAPITITGLIINTQSSGGTTLTITDMGSNSCSFKVSGTTEENNAAINLYPNPTADVLNIDFSNAGVSSFIISNAVGEKVLVKNAVNADEKMQLDISSLPQGIYFAEFMMIDGSKMEKKFTVIR